MAYLDDCCLDRHQCRPVQYHVCIELPHVAHTHPNLTELYVSLLATPYICLISSTCGTMLFLEKDGNHHMTLWWLECCS
jgi:hypothetical protein